MCRHTRDYALSMRRWVTAVLMLCAVMLIAAILFASPTRAASAPTVVSATVPSATYLDASGCPSDTSNITDFGIVLPNTSNVTTGDCAVIFGSSNDTAMLSMFQSDDLGNALVPAGEDNALSYWPLDASGADLGTLANSITLPASPHTPTYAAGRAGAGESLAFNGNEYASAPANAGYALDQFTVELWFKTTTIANDPDPSLIYRTNAAGNKINYGLNFDNGCSCPGPSLDFNVSVNGGSNRVAADTTTTASLVDGNWHYVAMTVDSANVMDLYVDGASTATVNLGSAVIDKPSHTTYLGSFDGTQNYFDGQIDDVRISDKAKTAAEIAAIWNGTNGVPDYAPGNFDWSNGTSMFGACLRAATGPGVSGVWATNATCPSTDGSYWNAIPDAAASPSSKIAESTTAGTTNAVADLRFGFRVAVNQQPGLYNAPVTLAVTAPDV